MMPVVSTADTVYEVIQEGLLEDTTVTSVPITLILKVVYVVVYVGTSWTP
jgi:hypothetical protein